MSIEEWNEEVTIAALADEPAFSEDLNALSRRFEAEGAAVPDVIVNLADVSYVNSSNIAQLLRVRKQVLNAGRRMRVCSVNDQVWGVLLITGLDKIFEFTEDVTTSLASLMMSE